MVAVREEMGKAGFAQSRCTCGPALGLHEKCGAKA